MNNNNNNNNNNWNDTGARNRAAARARFYMRRVPGYAGLLPQQQQQMYRTATATVAALFVGYQQGQPDIPQAAAQGAVAAAAAVGLRIPTHLLPRDAATYLTQQGIFAGWGAPPAMPANAFFPPLPVPAPPGPVAAAVAAPVAAPAAPVAAPAAAVNPPAGVAAPGGGGRGGGRGGRGGGRGGRGGR